jgi:hypothetical protein
MHVGLTCAEIRAIAKRCSGLILLLACSTTLAAALRPGASTEFKVELPHELRMVAGRGQLSPVTHALVTIAVPANFDAARDWPVLVVNSWMAETHSNRRLLRAYADAALAAGWIAIAADPAPEVPPEQDEVPLRFALDQAALGALEALWPRAAQAPLAFGGFSAGAMYSGWLAATFAKESRSIIGMYLAGLPQNTVLDAARQLDLLNDRYRRVPVFLQSGETDEIATMADHRRVQDELRRAGFRNVRIEYFPGPHIVNPSPLRTALDWFAEVAGQTTPSR